ncbi:MAG: response regulator [Anaerolineae bacterium]|nr:response regulator [Anaerolineae bacterium]MDW8172429.1 response regulator [Anaerolineae bacterium]
MSGKPKPADNESNDVQKVTILLVDDMVDTREGLKKLLSYEPDFKVVGTAGTGREGLEMTKQLKPDIVLMDINMPDMDGLEAASRITKSIWKTGVIMMSVQDDTDYIQRAMKAGARFFLPKPVDMNKLYSTIRDVYQVMEPMRRQWQMIEEGAGIANIQQIAEKSASSGDRAGHVIVVYSPQGGSGVTMLATSLASGLMKNNSRTLLIDANMEFGDVAAFLDIRPQATLADVAESAHDIDVDYFDNFVTTHNSGIRVLPGVMKPTIGADIRANAPDAVANIINQIRGYYDFIVVDTAKSLFDVVNASLFDIATKIVMIVTPTLPSIKNARLVLEVFDGNGFAPEKISIVINKNPEAARKGAVPPPEKIQTYLRRNIDGIIPLVDESFILNAINRGVPVIASDRDTRKAPIAQLLKYSDTLYGMLMGAQEAEPRLDTRPSGIGRIFGSR